MAPRVRGGLVAIALVAAFLRFWGLTYGLPHPAARPDEDLIVGKALRISLGEMSDPRDFNYSHGVYYLHAAALAAYRGVGHILGLYPDAASFRDDLAVGHRGLQYRICRTSSALMGTATALLAAREDTRVQAARWIDEHLPPHSRIAVCEGYGAPAINADSRRPPTYEPVRIPCSMDTVEETAARYVVTHTHPDIPFFRPRGRVMRWLRVHAEPLVVFDPFESRRGMNRCSFQGDAFYLPYCHFDRVERGGPIVTVWDLQGAPAPQTAAGP